ncbi:MAG TPA: FAD-binding protein [Xanthomonadales bacterium]|nr:FAD-binding protein [Xanthomonadales bacterium]
MTDYAHKLARLRNTVDTRGGQLRLAKSTVSNLFRYQQRGPATGRLSLSGFNGIIHLDADRRLLDVEGLATQETIVAHCLPRGLLPLVTPELRHITIGGAIVGIGIESSSFRHGFVHDGLVEADVLLPGGEVVCCSRENEHADLFRALPNSYGTLGYILRARIALQPALPFVHLSISNFGGADEYLQAMHEATTDKGIDFVEGLILDNGRFFLMLGRFGNEPPRERPSAPDDIVRQDVFWKLATQRSDICLRTEDYIFRYDYDWFWNVPDTGAYRLFRRYAPRRWRNSGFYTRYAAFKRRVSALMPGSNDESTEPLIQDWEVPWRHASELVRFCLENVPLDGRPWAALPIRPASRPTLYPVEPGELLFNLGCYCQVRKPAGEQAYHYTRIMDRKCFELDGIKMLYSSTFIDEPAFDARFHGSAYRELKRKYDPQHRAPTLFEKVAVPQQ